MSFSVMSGHGSYILMILLAKDSANMYGHIKMNWG